MCRILRGVSVLHGTLAGFDVEPQTLHTILSDTKPSHNVDSPTVGTPLGGVLEHLPYPNGNTVYREKTELISQLRHRFGHSTAPSMCKMQRSSVGPSRALHLIRQRTK